MALVPVEDPRVIAAAAPGRSSAGSSATGVAFVLPRADWIHSNVPLIKALAHDSDVNVTLVAPVGYVAPDGLGSVRVINYPFYTAVDHTGTLVQRLGSVFRDGRQRRSSIDRFFDETRPACLVVISDTSRELLPFVVLARKRNVRVVFMQSIFLATRLRQHVRSENWELARARGVAGLVRLCGLHLIQRAAGLPGTLFKSPAMGGRSDAVFVINEAQKDLFAEIVDPRRIRVTGTPFVDVLHQSVQDVRRLSDRAAFCRRFDCDSARPIVAYFSRSLEQFYHLGAAAERDAQEFYLGTLLGRLPSATVIVKLHPVEDERAFKRFVGHPRVRVVKELDVHELIHHSRLVVGIGPSTPTLLAVFHGRPRLIVVRVNDTSLEVQPGFLEVCRCVRSREEYELELAGLMDSGWPDQVSEEFRQMDVDGREKFVAAFDGNATTRARRALRELLGLA